jgi:phosphate transport system substrate-binding protein
MTTPHALLQRLNALPGVLGSMSCDARGEPLAQALPAGMPDGDIRAAATAAADSLRALGDAAGAPIHLDLHHAQRRLLVLPAPAGPVLLVCDRSVNAKLVLARAGELVHPSAAPAAPAPTPASGTPPPTGWTPVATAVASEPSASSRRPAPTPVPEAPPPRRRPPVALLAGAGAAAIVLSAVAGWALTREAPAPGAAPAVAAAAAPTPAPAAEPTVLLRIGGAKSFAAELAPALAKAWLESIDARDVEVKKTDATRFSVRGTRGGAPVAVEVEGMNTPDGFARLAGGGLDVAMSGRRIKPEWQAKLEAHGPMMVPGREHVVALSGIAVIVNPANPVPQLSREQLSGIFSGATAEWAAVGGPPGPIHVVAGDDRMGLTDLFRTLVLDKATYAPSARRFPTLQEITDAVALDRQAIGFVTLPFVRGSRAVPLAEGDSAALVPTAFTLATEDYPLTHRLYFYVLPSAEKPDVHRFVQFALGAAGQDVVKRSGYVELSVASAPRDPPAGAPRAYVRLTEGATRLSSTFRFEPGSSDFDVRALVDLERVTGYLVENRLNGGAVRVLGFADSLGKRAVNDALSLARAEQVAKALAQRGITGVAVDGFGSALPVASNATSDGRERNRRVEVWVAR